MGLLTGFGDFGLTDILNATKAYRDETLGFVNGRFAQSLTVFVDGTNGNDARTGLTNDGNVTTGSVKTLGRIANLYSGKVTKLIVYISGTLVHNQIVTLEAIEIQIRVNSGAVLTFAKRSLGAFGEGQYQLKLMASHVYVYSQGTINVEAHAAPPTSASEFNYVINQGAICLVKTHYIEYEAPKSQYINVMGGTINVGAYTTFVTTGRDAGENNPRALFSSPGNNIGTTFNVGTSGTIHDLTGNREIIRNYTPTSSTDANVSTGELCYDANFLYGKIGGTIKKIAWTAL